MVGRLSCMPTRPPSPQVLITWAWGHIPSCVVRISGLERLLYLTQGRGRDIRPRTPAISPATGTMCLDPLLGRQSGKPRWACPLLGETHHWEMCNNYDWPCKLRLHLRPQLPRQAGKGRTIIPLLVKQVRSGGGPPKSHTPPIGHVV